MKPHGRHANDVASEVDAYVDRAIRALKAEPARRWTVKALARVAGLSRAPFARRFRRATGTTPLRFLTEHRLALACARLAESDETLAVIANAVGYKAEFAFAKAFKRAMGIAPGLYRRRMIAMMRAGSARFRAAA